MMDIASAYWIDVKSKVTGNTTESLEGILSDAAQKSTKQLVTIIVYDLPNRDCKVILLLCFVHEFDLLNDRQKLQMEKSVAPTTLT